METRHSSNSAVHLLLTFTYTLLLLLPMSWAQCLHKDGPTPILEDKVKGSHVVVQGQIRRRVKVADNNLGLELDVSCVFKGGPVPTVINITSGAEGRAECVLSQLSDGRTHLVYLKRDGAGLFTPSFAADPDDNRYIDELEMVCGLQVEFPTGLASGQGDSMCTPDKFVALDYDCQNNPVVKTTEPLAEDVDSGSGHTLFSHWTFAVLLVLLIRGVLS